MPESRDRLSREENPIVTYRPQVRSINLGGNAAGRGETPFVLEDEPELAGGVGTPFRWRNTALNGIRGGVAAASARRIGRGRHSRGILATPDIRWRQNVGLENISPLSGRGRGRRGSVLPAWYPRTPFHDITSVVRVIERRSRSGEGEGQQTGSPILQDQSVYPFLSTPSAPLEHKKSMISPNPTIGSSRCLSSMGKVPRLLLDVTRTKDDDSCLTPQKKLLNSIDTVEKVVMEELRKLKRTPIARKVEREKRVRTLMSMR